jgi:hypothetical protein
MNETIYDDKVVVTSSKRPPAVQQSSTEIETDDLDDLELVVPDLSSVDDAAFDVGDHIDIQSPILLDVLSEKVIDQAGHNAKTVASGPQPAVQVVGATPKASEWDEW